MSYFFSSTCAKPWVLFMAIPSRGFPINLFTRYDKKVQILPNFYYSTFSPYFLLKSVLCLFFFSQFYAKRNRCQRQGNGLLFLENEAFRRAGSGIQKAMMEDVKLLWRDSAKPARKLVKLPAALLMAGIGANGAHAAGHQQL